MPNGIEKDTKQNEEKSKGYSTADLDKLLEKVTSKKGLIIKG